MKLLYGKMNLNDRHWLIGKLIDLFDKLNVNMKKEIVKFFRELKEKNLHEMDFIRFELSQEKDGCKREKIFEKRFASTKFIGLSFVRKLFTILKAKPCGDLNELLRKYEWKLNRMTINRIKELLAK